MRSRDAVDKSDSEKGNKSDSEKSNKSDSEKGNKSDSEKGNKSDSEDKEATVSQGLICTPAGPRQDVDICFCSLDAVDKSGSEKGNSDGAAGAAVVEKDNIDDSDDDPTYVPRKRKKRKKKNWGRCRAPPLSGQELHLLTQLNDYPCPFVFPERAMKEYKQLQSSPLHLNARNLFAAAIGQVVKQAKGDAPAKGNVKELFDRLFPLCVKVFQIPPSGAREVEASPEAVQKLINDNAYTFHDCVKYPKVYICANNDCVCKRSNGMQLC